MHPEFCPGDQGYVGGRWWADDGDGVMEVASCSSARCSAPDARRRSFQYSRAGKIRTGCILSGFYSQCVICNIFYCEANTPSLLRGSALVAKSVPEGAKFRNTPSACGGDRNFEDFAIYLAYSTSLLLIHYGDIQRMGVWPPFLVPHRNG